MPHSPRNQPNAHRTHPAPPRDLVHALLSELAMVWAWAVAPLKRLFEAAIRDGIRPPTTFDGLPPGQFPRIDEIKDELFPQADRNADAPFKRGTAPGTRIRVVNDNRTVR